MLPTKFRFICPSVSEKNIFLNRPIRNKNCLWWPCLLMDQDEMSNLYRGPSIDVSYRVSVHLAEGVSEEKIKMWKVNGRQMTDAKWWQKLTLPLAKKGALDSQPQVIKFASCLPMVGGSLRVLRLLPPLNLVAMI